MPGDAQLQAGTWGGTVLAGSASTAPWEDGRQQAGGKGGRKETSVVYLRH